MPKKTDAFVYQVDGLTFSNYQHDYFNAIVSRYQDVRADYMNQHGMVDDKNLVKERYSNDPVFISHCDLPPTTMVFANRANGYFAYTKAIDKTQEDPFYGRDIPSVMDYAEYLSRIHNTQDQGLFFLDKQLCIYATITSDNVYISFFNQNVPLLYFCDTFTYTPSPDTMSGKVGIVTLTSPYFTTRQLDVYSKDSLVTLEKYTLYATISQSDPHPTDKIPGEPIYKTVTISQFDSHITKVKVGGKTLTLSTDLNKVVVGTDERFTEGYLGIKYTGKGVFELGFSFPYKPDPLTQATLAMSLYIDGAWVDKTCELYFQNNHIHSLTTILTVDNQDKYLDVPASYTLRVENRYFLAHASQLRKTALFYLDEEKDVTMQYKGVVASHYVYVTDSVTISVEKGHIPTEYTFKLTDSYSAVNGFTIPVWCYGYTSGEIRPIPTDYIDIKVTSSSTFQYTEYGKRVYDFTFTYSGNMDLVTVALKTVADDYDYFTSSDFTLKQTSTSASSKTVTCQLTLDKKIIRFPQAVYQFPLRIVFKYTVKRIDGSTLNWPAETFTVPFTLTYVEDRWQIESVSIDNKLLGDAVVRYRLKDLLLNQYLNRFSSDPALIPNGQTQYSDNVTKYFDVSDWDAREKYFQDSVNVNAFGDITFQYQDVVAHSQRYTLTHNEPVHPLTVTPHPKTLSTNMISRVIIDVKYKEAIKKLYVNGSYLTKGIPVKLDNVKDGYGLLFPIFTADKKSIVSVGLDLTPLQTTPISVSLMFNEVNDYDFTDWPVSTEFTLLVEASTFNFTFALQDFAFDKNSTGTLTLNNTDLADAKIVAVIRNAANNVIVARPNFNPTGDGVFETVNLFIDAYLSGQREYYLDVEVYEFTQAAKDDHLPHQLYYQSRIAFSVS